MVRISRVGVLAVVAVVALTSLALAACSQPSQPAPLEPKVSPPAVKQAGTLRAGVDLSYPPFGGSDNGKQAGIDVDVAAALAERLGLKLEFVDVKSSQVATALADGDVDVALSAPFSASVLSRASIAGTYLSDGPAFFVSRTTTASAPPTLTAAVLASATIGAQQDSPAYWLLSAELGRDRVQSYPTLRAAFDGLHGGQVQIVGGDALVGGYIMRDLPDVTFAGQIAAARPIGVAVATSNTRLADAVRTSLDALAGDGVLSAIRSKWVGALPALTVPMSDETTSASVATSTAP